MILLITSSFYTGPKMSAHLTLRPLSGCYYIMHHNLVMGLQHSERYASGDMARFSKYNMNLIMVLF